MGSFDSLILVCLAYVVLLFVIAFAADRQAARGRARWLRMPVIYTLSLSVYCTGWTFYGAVGYAARSGLEYLTIYIGPSLVFAGWWLVLRRLVRVGRAQRATSIADLVSARYGKSPLIAVVVTLLAVVGVTPYIALQLQSVTLSFSVFAGASGNGDTLPDLSSTAFWVAAGLALFTILFGTRNLDSNERHHGVVTAIALEAVVKLVALLAVGIFVVWGVAGGPAQMMARIDTSEIAAWQGSQARWLTLTMLSAVAIICLPRMFQVMVVENSDERQLATASWAFPLYLMLISLFVVPIAVVGLAVLPEGSNPDLFVLTVPLALGRDDLAMLVFLGGFSSATSMVIVAAIALSTMISNHIVLPLWLRFAAEPGTVPEDLRRIILNARRVSIGGVVFLGYAYFSFPGGSEALAAIGLIAFVGVAQIMPALMGGLFWRGATRKGALAGLIAGFGLWLYTLFLPSFGPDVIMSAAMLAEGPGGIGWLRPQALLGSEGADPLLHSIGWSLGVNSVLFLLVSLVTLPGPTERLQALQYVNVFSRAPGPGTWTGGAAQSEDLLVLAQRILGPAEARALFRALAASQGRSGPLPEPTPVVMERLERELAGSVGSATAHAMIGQISGGATATVEDLLAVARETAQVMEYSAQLEAKSEELARTLGQLREVNEKLTALAVQKDAFLSQISHELRTPMTSIRAFSEILRDADDLSGEDRQRYASVILEESIRLTRLLDDLLDLSVLESGHVSLNPEVGVLSELIERAIMASRSIEPEARLRIDRDRAAENVSIHTDLGRLTQVFINLVSNARKYCDARVPRLRIVVGEQDGTLTIDFIDNGQGIAPADRPIVFEKFVRLTEAGTHSAGLGLAISREIMTNLGGSLSYLPGQGGAAFRVSLPRSILRAGSPAARRGGGGEAGQSGSGRRSSDWAV